MSEHQVDLQHLYGKPISVTLSLGLICAATEVALKTFRVAETRPFTEWLIEISGLNKKDLGWDEDALNKWAYLTMDYWRLLGEFSKYSPAVKNFADTFFQSHQDFEKCIRFLAPSDRKEFDRKFGGTGDKTSQEGKTEYFYMVTVGEFWRANLPLLTEALGQLSDTHLTSLVELIPEDKAREVMTDGAEHLIEYLRICDHELKVSTLKLSQLQKEILKVAYQEAFGGLKKIDWIPLTVLKDRFTSSDSISRSLRELYDRKLLLKYGKRKTTHVQLTHLGFMVGQPLFRK